MIDERVINKKKLNVFKIQENLVLAINSAKSIGCVVIGLHPAIIIDKTPHMILGLVW